MKAYACSTNESQTRAQERNLDRARQRPSSREMAAHGFDKDGRAPDAE